MSPTAECFYMRSQWLWPYSDPSLQTPPCRFDASFIRNEILPRRFLFPGLSAAWSSKLLYLEGLGDESSSSTTASRKWSARQNQLLLQAVLWFFKRSRSFLGPPSQYSWQLLFVVALQWSRFIPSNIKFMNQKHTYGLGDRPDTWPCHGQTCLKTVEQMRKAW